MKKHLLSKGDFQYCSSTWLYWYNSNRVTIRGMIDAICSVKQIEQGLHCSDEWYHITTTPIPADAATGIATDAYVLSRNTAQGGAGY